MKEKINEWGSFRNGLYMSLDSSMAPLGSARLMTNARISTRGGITKRPGVELLGTFNVSTDRCNGFGVLVKTDVDTEIPVKAYGTILNIIHQPLTLGSF